MEISQYEKRMMLHRAFADSFKKQLVRLLQRELTTTEVVCVEDSTLCLSFMSQEATDARLAHCNDMFRAQEELQFLVDTSKTEREKVLALLKKAAEAAGLKDFPNDASSLLDCEAAILEQMKSARSGV